MTKPIRGADIVARSLTRLGCTRVFTLSGNHIMSIFDAALETNLDLVHVATKRLRSTWRMRGGVSPATPVSLWSPAGPATQTRLALSSLPSAPSRRWCCCRGMRPHGKSAAEASRKSGKPIWRLPSPRLPGPLLRGHSGTRSRQGDPDRHVRAAWPGPFELAIGSSRRTGRKQRNCLAEYAENRRDRACARGAGCRCHTRCHRRCRTAGHPRGSSAIERQRTRTPQQIGGRDQGTGRDHGEPTRHRRRHARGVPGSGAAR